MEIPPDGSACTAIISPLPLVTYPAYSVWPMYMGCATKCVCTPLIVMFVADRTAAKFASVMVPVEVVTAV